MWGVVGWCEGAEYTSSARRPTIWIRVRLAAGAGGIVWTYFLSSINSLLSSSLWETARYRMKYFLKGPLSPNQPTKSSNVLFYFEFVTSKQILTKGGREVLFLSSCLVQGNMEITLILTLLYLSGETPELSRERNTRRRITVQ